MEDPAAMVALCALLAAPAPSARRAAATALAAIGTARDEIVRLAVEDPDPEVRRVCAAASAR
jgi:HEAT repeat protein